jgi:hypothetical protein
VAERAAVEVPLDAEVAAAVPRDAAVEVAVPVAPEELPSGLPWAVA